MIRTVLLALVMSATTLPALAGDAAARRVIGFSPDGRLFAFEQFGLVYEDTAVYAELQVIDTGTDRFVAPTPLQLTSADESERDLATLRQDLAARAATLLKPVTAQGTRIPGSPSLDPDQPGIYQMATAPLATALAVPLPDGRTATLTLATRDLGQAMCDGVGGRGTPGAVAARGLILRLALPGARPAALQDDRRLPKARRCATGYGIAEAHLHRAVDGGLTLAVLIEVVDALDTHAGPNRRFMAVTHRLKQP